VGNKVADEIGYTPGVVDIAAPTSARQRVY